MKLFLILLLLSLFILLGICIYLYYLYRSRLYSDIVYIIKNLQNNISFNKNDISQILTQSFNKINSSSKSLIKNHNSIIYNAITKKDGELINEFLSSLGKGDVDFEINNLNYYLSIFEDLSNVAKDQLKRNGPMYIKLLIGIGLIVVVIII